jgi:enediyne biosynthesis protein E4
MGARGMKRLALLKRFVSAVSASIAMSLFAGPSALAAFTDVSTSIFAGAPAGVNFESRSASLADIDNDGDLDLLFQGAANYTPNPDLPIPPRLYLNNVIGTGAHTFTDITSTLAYSLPTATNGSWSAAWGDYDGDGNVDVFIGETNSGTRGAVLKNNWPKNFSNESIAVGLNDPGFHQNVAWVDIDNNRHLDMVIGMEGPEKHQVYLQNAAGQFTAVGAAVGFQADFGTKAYGMAIGDTDGDGDLDVYISTCRADNNIRNNFFKNKLVESGTSTLSFEDIADTNGTQFMTNSYHAEFQDFDDDRDLDLFMVGADGERSKIFRNNGGNMFTDVDTLPSRGGLPLFSDQGGDFNGGKAVDYDNDGDLDLFFHDHLANNGKDNSRKLYRNDGDWVFTDVTAAQGIAQTARGAYDSVWGDIDLDGDQDLIAPTDGGFLERVFTSDASTNGNHWLYVELAGPSYDTTGIGASLYATINDGTPEERTLRREANTSAGTFNQSDLPVHFGLGVAGLIDQLRIEWPDGSSQNLFNVAVDQYLTVHYLPGDYSGNGIVDAADYVFWRKGFGTIYSQADYDVWRAHFGQSLPGSGFGASASIPEPTGACLIAVALSLFVGSGRRRS